MARPALSRSWRLAAAAILFAAASSGEAHGAFFWEHDLRSLVALSRCIVLAREEGGGAAGSGSDLKTLVIEKVYKGRLLPGMRIAVRDSYPRTDWGGKPVIFDPHAVLFLEAWDGSQDQRMLGSRERATHAIVHSGLRLLKDGRVYAVSDHAYPLAAPGEEQVIGFVPPAGGITLEAHEGQILEAIRVVESVRAMLARAGDARSRELLLRLIEKAYATDAAWRRKERDRGSPIFVLGGDAFLAEVVKRLLAASDLEGVLEVMARTELHEFGLETPTLFEAAERQLPARLRAAAIRALDIWRTRDTGVLARVAALASDNDAEVRKAALVNLRYAHRVYDLNKHKQTRAMTEFWAELTGRLPEIKEPEKREGQAADQEVAPR
jgi:hypothetical protein